MEKSAFVQSTPPGLAVTFRTSANVRSVQTATKAFGLVPLAAVCLLVPGLLAAQTTKGSPESILALPVKDFLQQSVAAGDTRVMAVPLCGAETPGILTSAVEAPDAEGTHLDLDPGCAWVFGKEGRARLAKMRAYAEEYNRLLQGEMERQGLFEVYPRDAQPFSPEKKGEQEAIIRRAKATLEALLGQPTPDVTDSRVWKTYEGTDSRLWIDAKLAPADFAQRFPAASWKEIALPAETLSTMHLSRATPKSTMTCFVGRVGGQRAYVFWSEELGTLSLVVALP